MELYEEVDAEGELIALEELMEEPPGGALGRALAIDQDFLLGGGWSVVHPYKDGLKGHYGVTHPAEHVDATLLRSMVQDELGFDLDELGELYSHKHLSLEGKARRAQIDARLLEIYDAGGNMFQLAAAIGLNQRTMNRAVVRARQRGIEAGPSTRKDS